jgi:predicted transcriptional regulator
MASQHLGEFKITETLSLGDMVISAVTATTFIVQIVGPPMVKLSIRLAGENDRNITEEDIMEKLSVEQAMTKAIEPLQLTDRVSFVVKRFSLAEYLAYPVVNADGKLAGVLSLSHLKDILMDSDCWNWMVVQDVLIPQVSSIEESAMLKKAMTILEETGIDQLVVVDQNQEPTGIVDIRQIREAVERERLALLTG